MNQNDRILGALYGQALGDAMGMPSELWPKERVESFFGWIDSFLDGPKENSAACYFSKGQFTDDTSMALALCEAIIQSEGKIIPEVIGGKILIWAESFDAFNKNILGPTSKIALYELKKGTPITQLENNGLTNGAAMRASPLGCLLPTQPFEHFVDEIVLASSPTHKSDISVAGAAVIAWSISKAIEGASWISIKKGVISVAETVQKMKITTFSPSLSKRIEHAFYLTAQTKSMSTHLSDIYHIIGAGTLTLESVSSALAIVDLAKTDPNEAAILSANLGGDTDTIGAMATAICGALNGVKSIRSDWLKTIDDVNQCNFEYYSQQLSHFRRLREAVK